MYDKKLVLKYLVTILALTVGMKFSDGAAFVVLAFFALAALFQKKTERLVFYLLLANATLVVNGFFMPKGFVYSIAHRSLLTIVGLYGVLLFLSLRPNKYVSPLMGGLLYIFYMLIPSSIGWAPTISLLKIFLFLTVYMALAYASNSASRDNKVNMKNLRAMILAHAIFFILGSVLVAPFPAISNMNSIEVLESGGDFTSLYKGMCSHSQTLGMVIAFWVMFLVADLIFHVQRMDKLYIILIIFGLGLIFKSSGRTAMGTMIACCGFAYMFFSRYRGRIRSGWRMKIASVVTGLVILGGLGAVAVPQIRDGIVRFAMKYDTEAKAGDFNMEYAVGTRRGLADNQLENFKKRPAIGWGFQVSEQVATMAKDTKGLILSAPVEKGVWVTAILEEGGVFGGIIYMIYFFIALCLLYARKAYMGLTMFLAIHISNLGEMTMFSMSGCGGLWYTFLFIALVFDAKRIQGANVNRYNYYSPMPSYRPNNFNPIWR